MLVKLVLLCGNLVNAFPSYRFTACIILILYMEKYNQFW